MLLENNNNQIDNKCYRVEQFIEKPNIKNAKKHWQKNEFLWNTLYPLFLRLLLTFLFLVIQIALTFFRYFPFATR